MADIKNVYPASSDLTITLASLATSSTLVAGRESTLYDNSTNLYLDVRLSGIITVGTTPTANKQIQLWVMAESKDGTWPDVFDGTDSDETWTKVEIRDAAAKLAHVINVVATTSDVGYYFDAGSVAALFGGVLPRKFVVWVTHETVAALNATGGNHRISVSPNYNTAT